MSIPFTQLKGKDAALAGYLRIGHVVLSMPPTDILTNKVSAKERVSVLLGSNDLVKFTGHGRFDVTVRWTAMLDDAAANSEDKYKQWEDLRTIVAIFKAAPFVEIENSYIRQSLGESDPTLSANNTRMAFGLRQLRISIHPDIIDAFDCSLTMTWFNYAPYSNDFGYVGGGSVSTDADRCSLFADPDVGYIATWLANNMDTSAAHFGDDDVPTAKWKDQIPGTVKFSYREYTTVKYNRLILEYPSGRNTSSSTPSAQATNPNPSPTSTAAPAVTGQMLSAHFSQRNLGVDGASPEVIANATYICNQLLEPIYSQFGRVIITSGYRPPARNASAGGKKASYHLYNGSEAAADIVCPSTTLQVLFDWIRFNKSLPFDKVILEHNSTGALACVHLQIDSSTSGRHLAYTGETGNATNYEPVSTDASLLTVAGTVPPPLATQPNLQKAAAASPTASPSTPSNSAKTDPTSGLDDLWLSLSPVVQSTVLQNITDGWKADYATNDLIYMYKSHSLKFADNEHGDSSTLDNNNNPIAMFPRNISILMVNNLAQIPLASYAYPTYQHIGSPSSLVSIAFTSIGVRKEEESEPQHAGVSLLSGISSFLDQQYLTYRHNQRRVDSLHRFQAVYVESQVLNMFGIRGLTFDNVSSETIPSTADEIQVELTASQYENTFESTPPYKINSIDQIAATVTKNIIQSGAISSLSANEQQAIPLLSAFAKGRASSNIQTLNDFILSAASDKTVSFGSFSNTPTINPTQQQISDMLALVVVPATLPKDQQQNSLIPLNNLPSFLVDQPNTAASYNIAQYPAAVARLTSLQPLGNNPWTSGDVLLVGALASEPSQTSSAPFAPIPESVTSTLKVAQNDVTTLISQSNFVEDIQSTYDQMFNILASSSNLFAQNVNTLSNNPKFSSQYTEAMNPSGPALNTYNTNPPGGPIGAHSSYRGMGLKQTYTSGGVDYTPAYYFTDHSQQRISQFQQEINVVINGAKDTSESSSVNQLQNSSEYSTGITDLDFIGLNANVDQLVRSTNIPGMTMSEAFPTFKLFLMEDSAPGIINCFDNFYSYASVTEMEIIRYRDQPDVAVLQITNIANLLLHRLYDDTVKGRYEYGLEQYKNVSTITGGAITGKGQDFKIMEGSSLSKQNYIIDLSDKINNQRGRIPLQYVALQPGTKIQIRMGYSNNPDLLTPVFTGRATKIDVANDMLIVTAESYLGELCTIPVYGGELLGDKAYGKEWTNSDSGTTECVVEKLLDVDSAKHFGRLKLVTTTDQMVTGLTWTQRTGQSIGGIFKNSPNNKLTEVGAAMAASYDRSKENILINHMITFAGTPKNLKTPGDPYATRAFEDESSTKMYYSFLYNVPKNSTFTTWDLIKDVCRRYPEYNVCCKQYGFPWSADATLVVAHPLDWYYARPPLLGDAEKYRTGPQATKLWPQWWESSGKKTWDIMVTKIAADLNVPEFSVRIYLNNPEDPTSFEAQLAAFEQKLLVFEGAPPQEGNVVTDTVEFLLNDVLANTLTATATLLNVGGGNVTGLLKGKIETAKLRLQGMRDLWYQAVQMQSGQTATDRLKPVRRYHFIEHNSIVHNSISLNESIYNTIRVGDSTYCANANIPTHYRRVLDVTDLLNDPKDNIDNATDNVRELVAQSFLREEVGKMYRGELVLRGIPEIEPYDCLIITDPSTGIAGIVEVDKVIQSFSMENGYITIVYPRAFIAVNESATAGLTRMFCMVWGKTLASGNGLNILNPNSGISKAFSSLDTTQKVIVGAVVTAFAGVTLFWVGVAASTGTLGLALMAGGVLATGWRNQKGHYIQVMPMTKFGLPWMGGLEGYQITDMWANYASQFKQWEADNIFPLIDSYRSAVGQAGTPLPIQ